MKLLSSVRKFGPQIAAVGSTLFFGVSAHAAGEGAVDTIFAAIDLTTIAASVLAMGVLIIGVAMAFKGVDLGKRGVRKV